MKEIANQRLLIGEFFAENWLVLSFARMTAFWKFRQTA